MDIFKNVLASIISAIIIAFIFAVWSDSEIDLTGKWTLETTTKDAIKESFKNMKLTYESHLIELNEEIIFNSEKTKEKSVNGEIEYHGKERTYLKCTGEKKYKFFSKNKLIFHCEETGKERKSITILDLTIESKDKITGTFQSTISDSSGDVEIIRN
jgi:bisphosphoglycerate-dependent phosphoglycerate mutase